MKTRIIAAAIALPLLLVVLLVLPPVATAILLSLMCVVAVWELMGVTKLAPNLRLMLYSALMSIGISFWSWKLCPQGWGTLMMVIFFLLLAMELMIAHSTLKFPVVCVAAFSGIVVPYMLTALVRLQMMEGGRFLVLVPCVIAFMADTGAYFAGRAFGRHKLAPIISPKKTIEGAVGGVLSAMAAMALYALILQLGFKMTVNYFNAVIYGAVGSFGSIVGDLVFSVIKRQAKIKDYGNILPGHGGILDRFDSMVVVAPLVEALVLLLPFITQFSTTPR